MTPKGEQVQPEDSEAQNCPACSTGTIALRNYSAPHNGIRYTLNHCPHCELEFWNPLVADTTIYEDSGFSAYRDYHAGRRPFPRWALPLVREETVAGYRTLDIGCGDGAVMARLQDLGAHVSGMDLDPQSVAVAESRCGPGTCVTSTLEEYIAARPASQPSFDLVSFFEVLEHQVDPKGFLAQVSQLVESGGTIVGSVPNRERFLAKVDRWVDRGDMPPHHFLWFSAKALTQLLLSAGFKEVDVRRIGALSLPDTINRVSELVAARVRAAARLPSVVERGVATAVALPVALVYWAGRNQRPSHLYFRCRA